MAFELHVSGFPFEVDALTLRNFLGVRQIRNIKIVKDRLTKRSKGYAFVTCYSKDDATIVKRKDGYIMGGRKLNVKDSRKSLKRGGRRSLRTVEVLCNSVGCGMWKERNLVYLADYPGISDEKDEEEEEEGEEEIVGNEYSEIGRGHDVSSVISGESGGNSTHKLSQLEALMGFWNRIRSPPRKKDFNREQNLDYSNISPYTLIFSGTNKIRFQIIYDGFKYYIDLKTVNIERIWIGDYKLVVALSFPPIVFKVRTFYSIFSLDEREVRNTDLNLSNLLSRHNIFIFDINPSEFHKAKLKIQDIQQKNFSIDSEVWSYTAHLKFTETGASVLDQVDLKLRTSFRNLDVGYLLHACISERTLNKFHINDCFIRELQKHEEESIEFLTSLFFYGSDGAYYDEEMHFVSHPLGYFEKWRSERKKKKRRNSSSSTTTTVMVKRILITPLSVYYIPEELDIGNSVTREYSQHIKSFARVSFVDETQREMKIRHTESISKRIKRVLLHGIRVGGYHFRFLAFSNSQLRGASLWMLHEKPQEGLTCENTRRWMGNFERIKNLAKYCARLGQCFSTTKSTVDLKKNEFIVQKDITTYDGKYIFTDGCGMICESLTKEIVHKKLKLREFKGTDRLPGAFQIRFNGAKGVLAVYPDHFFQRGVKVVLRESMMKFYCHTHYNIGVIRYSTFRPCYLNRQVIALLSTRGIKDEVFLTLQQDMLIMLEEMFEHEQVALKVLSNFSSNNEFSKMLTGLIKSGFSVKLPFIQKCLRSISKYKRIDLQTKSKIYVERGSLMIGVCDESKRLRYGECFVRTTRKYSTNNGMEIRPYIHHGPVVVSKNPAFHPGDIRVLVAVDVPELRHLSNVIVFPVSGHRDHPNEISGSDLDGDIYFVCWEPSLIPYNENYKPMDYSPEPAKVFQKKIQVKHMADFFVDSLKNDQLGRIANAHLAHYAFSPNKCLDENCIELSRLHSIAVDFPKTGVPADLPYNLSPHKYPLFMEKEESKHSQMSECVVEKLYEMIKIPEYDAMDFLLGLDPSLMVRGYEKYIKEAIEIYHEYAHEIEMLMRKHRIRVESDVYSFLFVKYNRKVLPERQMKEIKYTLKEIVTKYRDIFHDGMKEEGGEIYKKAYAWYFATWLEVGKKMKERKMKRQHDERYGKRRKKQKRDFTIRGFAYFVLWRHLCDVKKMKKEKM